MDHPVDLAVAHEALQAVEVADVGPHLLELPALLRAVQDHPEPVVVVARVERDDLLAVGEELPDDPRADAAVGAGDEDASAHAAEG